MDRPKPFFQRVPVQAPIVETQKIEKIEKIQKQRTERQLNANRRRGEINRGVAKVLKSRGLKANLKTRYAYKKWLDEGKNPELFFSEYGLARTPTPQKKANATRKVKQTTFDLPVQPKSGHSEAGKKAATSEKGRAWLDDIKRAKDLLDKALREAGAPEAGQQKNARKLASIMRKTPSESSAYIGKIVQDSLQPKSS
jgi:hypothetical protein